MLGLTLKPWFFDLSKFWTIDIVVFLSGIVWKVLTFVIGVVMYFVTVIPSNKRIGYYTEIAVAGINTLLIIYRTWTFPDEYSTKGIIGTLVIDVFILVVTFTVIGSSFKAWDEEKYNIQLVCLKNVLLNRNVLFVLIQA